MHAAGNRGGRALRGAGQAHAQVHAGAERGRHLLQPPRQGVRRLGAAPVEQRLRGRQLGSGAHHPARAGRRGGLQLRGHRHQLAGRPAAELSALRGWRTGSHLRHLLGAATAGRRRLRQLHHPRPERPAADRGSAHQLLRRHHQSLPQHLLGGGGFHPRRERAARGAGGGGAAVHQRRVRGVRGAAAGHRGSSGALDRRRHHRVEPGSGGRLALQLRERRTRRDGRGSGRRHQARRRHRRRGGRHAHRHRAHRCPAGAGAASGGLRRLCAGRALGARQGTRHRAAVDRRRGRRGPAIRHATATRPRAGRRLHRHRGRRRRSRARPGVRRRQHHQFRVGAHRPGREAAHLQRAPGRAAHLRRGRADDQERGHRPVERHRHGGRLGSAVLPLRRHGLSPQRRPRAGARGPGPVFRQRLHQLAGLPVRQPERQQHQTRRLGRPLGAGRRRAGSGRHLRRPRARLQRPRRQHPGSASRQVPRLHRR